jgi:hypothetical protein
MTVRRLECIPRDLNLARAFRVGQDFDFPALFCTDGHNARQECDEEVSPIGLLAPSYLR